MYSSLSVSQAEDFDDGNPAFSNFVDLSGDNNQLIFVRLGQPLLEVQCHDLWLGRSALSLYERAIWMPEDTEYYDT